jgi:hypothetical protein
VCTITVYLMRSKKIGWHQSREKAGSSSPDQAGAALSPAAAAFAAEFHNT